MTTTSLNIFNYLIPLLVTPYFVRISGAEHFGHLSIAQTTVQYLFLLVGFNLDTFGTAEMAVLKNDREKSRLLFWQIFHGRILLFFISTLIFIGIAAWYWHTGKNTFLLGITFLGLIGYTLTPLWFYQGVEDFFKLFVGIAIGKVAFALIVFICVQNKDDYWYYNLGISISHIVTGLLLTGWAIKRYKLPYQSFSITSSWRFIKEKFSLFRAGTIIQFGYNFNITLLSFILTIKDFGIYMAANKLILVSYSMVALPLSQSIFPYISRSISENFNVAIETIRQTILPGLLYSACFICLGGIVFSKYIILIMLGEGFSGATYLFSIMIISLVFYVLTNVLYLQIFVKQNKLRAYSYVSQTSVLASILITITGAYLYGATGAAIAWTLNELFLLIISSSVLSKTGISLFNRQILNPRSFYQFIQMNAKLLSGK